MYPITFHISRAESEEDFRLGRTLIEEYVTELGIDLSFQGYAEEREHLSEMYGAPGGCLLIGWSDSDPAGCICLRRHTSETAEMKRLYVRPAYREMGLAHRLVAECLSMARAADYRRVVLDTLSTMETAYRLYSAFGFEPVQPYYTNPIPGTRYLGLEI